jgi:hypothetical protein
MNNIFIISFVISIIFTIIKIIEMKFIESEYKKPLKYLIRDSLLVYFSVIAGDFILEQVSPSIQKITNINTTPNAFLSEPIF